MKTWILGLMMMVGITVSAQHRKEHHEPLKPEQRAELQAKKMTLALNLNEKQQKEVQQLFLDRQKERQQLREQYKANKAAGKKLTPDERFALKNKMLEDKIATKAAMQKILTPEQFAKLDKMEKDRKITKRNKIFKSHKRR